MQTFNGEVLGEIWKKLPQDLHPMIAGYFRLEDVVKK